MDRIRVAALQYFIRPVRSFADFREPVAGLVRGLFEMSGVHGTRRARRSARRLAPHYRRCRRTTSTEHGAALTTNSATLPSSVRLIPVRP